MSNMICYEQPVNEHTRVCLRVEYLLDKIRFFIDQKNDDAWQSQVALFSIVELLTTLDRPDLRSKLSKEIFRHLGNLNALKSTSAIDPIKLDRTLVKLKHVADLLEQGQGRFAEGLREHPFIEVLRGHTTAPGGATPFRVPSLKHWLSMTLDRRMQDMGEWLAQFDDIAEIVSLLLNLIRESASPVEATAEDGFFQTSLDPQSPCQLVRVSYPRKLDYFPQISVGRYGINLRFFSMDTDGATEPVKKDITFNLTCCIL